MNPVDDLLARLGAGWKRSAINSVTHTESGTYVIADKSGCSVIPGVPEYECSTSEQALDIAVLLQAADAIAGGANIKRGDFPLHAAGEIVEVSEGSSARHSIVVDREHLRGLALDLLARAAESEQSS